jgi:Tfp pilus tip-associated adhesin PilY1
MDYLIVAIVVVILLIIGFWYRRRSGSSQAPASTAQVPGHYSDLIQNLTTVKSWIFSNASNQGARSTLVFSNITPGTIDVSLDGSKATTYNYGPFSGNSDTAQLLDPSLGGPDKYVMYVMYSDPQNIIVEEKTAGKISFQNKLTSYSG